MKTLYHLLVSIITASAIKTHTLPVYLRSLVLTLMDFN